jgi:MFS family permease
MFDWYSSLSPSGRRTFWACCGGYALDAMDVQIYSFVVPALIALWGISNTQAGAVATVALIMSAIGGWGAGLLSDRFGRVLTLQITIGCFALFTFLSGLTSNFGEILVTRGLQAWALAASGQQAPCLWPRSLPRAIAAGRSALSKAPGPGAGRWRRSWRR